MQRIRYVDQAAIEGQFAAQLVQLPEIEGERPLALQPHGLTQDLRSDERIAIAIASDPAPDPKKRPQRASSRARYQTELILEIVVEARQLPQERVIIIGEPVHDLVNDPQPFPT